MKLEEAIEQFKLGRFEQIEVMRNPSKSTQWFAMLRKTNGKSLMLADSEDDPIVVDDIEALFSIIKKIGFHEAKVFFSFKTI